MKPDFTSYKKPPFVAFFAFLVCMYRYFPLHRLKIIICTFVSVTHPKRSYGGEEEEWPWTALPPPSCLAATSWSPHVFLFFAPPGLISSSRRQTDTPGFPHTKRGGQNSNIFAVWKLIIREMCRVALYFFPQRCLWDKWNPSFDERERNPRKSEWEVRDCSTSAKFRNGSSFFIFLSRLGSW